MSDPIPDSTRYVWEHAPDEFREGRPMGPTEIAHAVYLHPVTVHYHLARLHAAGLVRKISIGRVKHHYAGIPPE